MVDNGKQNRFRKLLKDVKEREKENGKTFRDILKDLADSSSLHGIPRIVASRQTTVKVLWSLLFIATCSLLGYQLLGLYNNYYSYPIQTVVKLDSSAIKFPAISLCNMNPVKYSELIQIDSLNFILNENTHQANSTEPTTSLPDGDYNYDYFDDQNDWDSSVNTDRYLDQQLSGNVGEWTKRVNKFKVIHRGLDLELRTKAGHQLKEFIFSVDYAGTEVNVSRLQHFTSPIYGNCFTLSSRQFISLKSGPANGITITLNLETDEYVEQLSTGYGARLVLHEPGTYPLPYDEGITLSPGTETNLGLKMVRISRLGQPYGICTAGDEFQRQYKKRYSVA
ncbi:amiloride-sensitive sodium channel subunit beta-like, partial [Ruditapes philippinarum]|uniref:amiloride-sensitive sodium channel subunit beta-like n=1 Tax=Ruditapes philippinarum TaxID=129788 RepID=UPI00295B0E4C